eukprot:5231389-Prymnesium_polylepis.1
MRMLVIRARAQCCWLLRSHEIGYHNAWYALRCAVERCGARSSRIGPMPEMMCSRLLAYHLYHDARGLEAEEITS